MTEQQRSERIRQALDLVREAKSECGVPMIESALGEAERNLHWVLWNLGEPVELLPELE